MNLNLPKWAWVKVLTHLQVISNLCVNFQYLSIGKIWTGQKFCAFLPDTLKLPGRPLVKVMIHPQIISNLCVNYKLPMFLHKKDIDRTQILYFFCQWPCPNDLRSLASLEWSKNFQWLSIRKIWTIHELCNFTASDLHLARMTLCQGNDTASGQKQYFSIEKI